MRTQIQIINQIFATAKVLEDMTKPDMLPVESYDATLRAAAHDYAWRLEMQADACDPALPVEDTESAWHRVEHGARRLGDTLRDLEQTPANKASLHAAIALADHCRDNARDWRAHPVGGGLGAGD